MAVFTTHEAAMEFASGDPFVQHGVVSAWQIREWRVAISTDPSRHGLIVSRGGGGRVGCAGSLRTPGRG